MYSKRGRAGRGVRERREIGGEDVIGRERRKGYKWEGKAAERKGKAIRRKKRIVSKQK